MQYVIVTGATGAIGTEISKALADRGYGLILACRNLKKATQLAEKLPKSCRPIFLPVDLADADTIHKAVGELPRLVQSTDSIVGLINNAGVMSPRHTLAPSGQEMDYTVNYLHTRLLTESLIDAGLMAHGASVVFTTSLTRHLGRGRSIPKAAPAGKFSRLGAYGRSKRALTIYASSVVDRMRRRDIYVNCADPGIVDSDMITMRRWYDPIADLFFRPFIRSPRKGAEPALRAFHAGLKGESGRIYCRRRIHQLPQTSPES